MTILSKYADMRAQFAPARGGSAASVTAASGGQAIIAGLSGMSPAYVGQTLAFSNAASSGNNGTVRIVTYVSSAEVVVANPTSVAPDANNGAIRWKLLQDDGFPLWGEPPTPNLSSYNYLRAGGFSNTWQATSSGGTTWTALGPTGPLIDPDTLPATDPLFPLTITINAGASDGGTGDKYLWYLSQRVDPGRLPGPDGTPMAADVTQLFKLAHIPPASGNNASITVEALGQMTIVGLSGVLPSFVGQSITIAGAQTPGNNGTFTISSVLSPSSVKVANLLGAGLDKNNGMISWTMPQDHSGTVVLTTNPGPVQQLYPLSGGTPPLVVSPPYYPTVDPGDVLKLLFTNVQLYVMRKSDHAYQWANLIAPPIPQV